MQNKMWMLGMMLIAFFVGMMFSQNTAAQQGELGRYQIALLGMTIISISLESTLGMVKCGLAFTTMGLLKVSAAKDGRASLKLEEIMISWTVRRVSIS